MNALIIRLRRDDSGLSIVEVVVAMLIFALISTGSIYSMLRVLQSTRDSRSQQVAANLAAQDIDLARDYSDLFKLVDTAYDIPLNGDIFHVKRDTEWVNSSSGNDVQCASGGAELSYKRVNVTVTWDNMSSSNVAVRSDTVVDPKSRITDPTKGTLLVSVLKDGGGGSPGVTVTATPAASPNGAVTPVPNSVVTDASGCAYILKVTPGNYDIKLTHNPASWVDEKQMAAPVKYAIGINKSATASVGFQYAAGGILQVSYAPNYVNSTRPLTPVDLDTTFSNSYGSFTFKPAASAQFLLHPFTSGYQSIAGVSAGCLAVDPQEWTPNFAGKVAAPTPFVAALEGTTTPTNVPMGVIEITKTGNTSDDRFLRAVSVDNSLGGQPGCATTTTYRFGKVLSKSKNAKITVALPFGTWMLYSDGSATTTSSNSGDLIGSNGSSSMVVLTDGLVLGSAAILDPRPAS